MLPQVIEIALVQDALAQAEAEIGERDFAAVGMVVALARPHRAIAPAVQLEGVKVLVVPPERDLDGAVQTVQG